MRRGWRLDIGGAAVEPLKAVSSAGVIRSDVPLTVETFDNHIWFYSDVDSDRVLALIRSLREIDVRLRTERITRSVEGQEPTPIWLHIHSNGGDLFSALSVADQMMNIETPIYTIVEGMVASAATMLSLAGKKRFALPSAFMCVHQFSSWAMGTYEQLEDDHRVNQMLIRQLREFYVQHTGQRPEWVEETLKHDYYMDTTEMIERGFIDAIL